MKYRIFSVMVILAMVASLCAITAAPASAAAPTGVAVTVTPDLANKDARYDIAITGTALGIGDSATVVFPSGTQMPATIDPENVRIDGVACDTAGYSAALSGRTLVVTTGAATGATYTVTVDQAAGIKNPQLSKTNYTVQASSNLDTTPAPGVYTINDWIAVISPANMQLAEGDPCVLTGAGFMAGYTVVLTGSPQAAVSPLSGQGTVGTNGTFEFTAYGTGVGTPTAPCVVATDGSGRSAWTCTFQALPTIEVVPTSGPTGRAVLIKGKNFWAAPFVPAVPGTITIPGPIVLMKSGSITVTDRDLDGLADDFQVLVTIPRGLNPGKLMISCPDAQVPGIVATTEYEIIPRSVTVSPGSGAPGTSVTIEGAGWVPGEDFGVSGLLYGNTTAMGTPMSTNIEVDDQGNFSVVGKIPSNATPGMHGVVVFFDPTDTIYHGVDPQGDELAAQTFFVVTGRAMSVVPSSGPLGTVVTLSGGDFGTVPPAQQAGIYLNTAPTTIWKMVNLTTSGDIVPANFEITSTSFGYGDYILTAMWNTREAVGEFEVTRPTISLDKSIGPRGTQVVITGSGWYTGVDNFVTLYTDWTQDGDPDTLAVVQPDAEGGIWSQIKISSDAVPGSSIQVWGVDNKKNQSLKDIFTVTDPSISVDPEAAAVGDTVVITGTGFAPQSPIDAITLGGARIVRTDYLPITDTKGGFEVEAIIPGLAPGGKALTVTDSSVPPNMYTVPFTIIGDAGGATTVQDGLATIEGLYTKVWTFDAVTQQWQVYDTAEGAPDDFTTLVKGQGYWIYVTQDVALVYGPYTYNLSQGWNLIGWLG